MKPTSDTEALGESEAPQRPEASSPPLQALRAFEASARLRSLSRAAEELGVTPSAITHHVRAVEKWVGAPLFRRTGRSVIPTATAEAALPSLTDGFERLQEGINALRAPDRKNHVISVSVAPAFGSKWLLPRLERFRARHPDVEVWVSADIKLVDFSSADVDLAIRYGGGVYEGLVVEKILDEIVTPLAAPALLAAIGPIRTVQDLLRAPLLHDISGETDPACPSWRQWFKARGIDEVSAGAGPRYNDASLVIDEAVAGAGVALARRAIAERDVIAGRLQPALDDVTPLRFGYWMVWPRGRTLLPPVRAFMAWLRSETVGDIADGAGI